MYGDDEMKVVNEYYRKSLEKKREMCAYSGEMREKMLENFDKYYRESDKEFFEQKRKICEEVKEKGITKEDIESIRKQLQLMKEHEHFTEERYAKMKKYIEESEKRMEQYFNK